MNDLLLLGGLAAAWYFLTRGEEPTVPVPGAHEGIGENQFPIFSERAAGDPLPPSVVAAKPDTTDQPIGNAFKAMVVPPRPPPRFSLRTTRVSNT